MGYDVFISCSSRDKPAADAVCAALEANEVRCWIAPRDINAGESWAAAIVRGISVCRMMVLIFSPDANSSEPVKTEVALAKEGGKVVAPFCIRDVLPTGDMKFHLTRAHWMDARTQPLDKHLPEFVRSIRATLGIGQPGSAAADLSAVASVAPAAPPSRATVAVAPSPPEGPEDKARRPQQDYLVALKELFLADRIAADQYQLGRALLRSDPGGLDDHNSNLRAQLVTLLEGKLAPDKVAAAFPAIAGAQRQPTSAAPESPGNAIAPTAAAPAPARAVPSRARPTVPVPPSPPKPGATFTNILGMKFVGIEAGSFLMGSPQDEEGRADNELQHRVNLTRPFYMATTPVTQKQWRAVLRTLPGHFEGDDLPVEQVSWLDAVSFCQKLSEVDGQKYRLPTEAEWEYCCRAGTTTPFITGRTISTDQANYDGHYTYGDGVKGQYRGKTTPVGSFKPNAWGLFDMHGNVSEWCSDGYGAYDRDPAEDPRGHETSSSRVLRGGSWAHHPRSCRSACRSWIAPDVRSLDVGLRVCLDV